MHTIDELFALQRFGVILDLSRITALMQALGNPQKSLAVVHIAGTNGKGSVCAMVESVLRKAGYKVGLYTSPHLLRFTERIQINREQISDADVDMYYLKVKAAAKQANVQLTFFEAVTAMMFCYFADQKVDYAVIEVGLGGRLDATNVLVPIVSVITSIDLDHEAVLGETIEAIAKEKAGIIKPEIPVVSGAKGEAAKIIAQIAKVNNAPLVVSESTIPWSLELKGSHQLKNASVAKAVIDVMRLEQNVAFTEEHLRVGIQEARWLGRMQWLSWDLLIDGAHNPSGMKALGTYLNTLGRPVTLVLGVKQNKHLSALIEQIPTCVQKIICTESSVKPLPAAEIAKAAALRVPEVEVVPQVREALEKAEADDHLVVCAGSLFLVADVLKIKGY